MKSLLLVIIATIVAKCSGEIISTLDPIGPNFWNARQSFYALKVVDIGTHMSVVQLDNGNFLVIDTIELQPLLKEQLDNLTHNGSLIEAVVATHPFHTTYFPAFYAAYPDVPFYGTPRHLRIEPSIPWAGNVTDPSVRTKWSEVQMRIPTGAEFIDPQPESENHFAGMFVFHNESHNIHIDDTIMVEPANASWIIKHEFFPNGPLAFHPTLKTVGICHFESAPGDFENFITGLINDWDFDNILGAHMGRFIGGAKEQLATLLKDTQPVFEELTQKYANLTGVCQ
eukprot:TRINITY_DN692_c0_g1_i1.p1 TRINITY_DN692_c0_g1~~TRINITY_DN692_c0_g1_i1.p1  ORF type:complete len:284 (+),score=65.99 TRINITY_DN692_c0_g1_i1:30-881(+)